jgi:excisionase family DNA binding protein
VVVSARYLTVDAAAEYLSLTPKAVRRMIERGDIPHYRVGARLRFDVTDLDAWMRKHRVEAW